MTGYLTQRGRESDGRYCLAIPNREIRNIITERILTLFQQEVKYTDEKKDLERDCRKALEQIRDKDYTQTLWQEGYKKMVQYGIAFHLKQCCVMEEEMQRKRNRDGALNRYNLL